MSNLLRVFVTVVVVSLLTSCAAAVHRGSIAMKINNNEAHVCLGKGEVVVGDKIKIFRNVCSTKGYTGTKPGLSSRSFCVKKLIGSATITEVLNNHYSIAKIENSVEYREGDIVEKD